MAQSDRFNSRLKKLKKSDPERSDEKYKNQIKETLFQNLGFLSSEMQEDIFFYFSEKIEKASELQDILSVIIDIYHEDYDPEERLLSAADWEYIKEITSEFGIELEEKLLTYVMSLILDKGLF